MNEVLNNKSSFKVPTPERFKDAYVLHLADNSLIMGHRLSEWAGHGPMLEQDIAISNIALDLIGQARNFYQYAAQIINSSKVLAIGDDAGEATEDTLAYLRDAKDFKNIILTELPNGDWANTILKLFFFSTYQYLLYRQLFNSLDKQISAIAEKSLKEVTYHVKWSSEWVIRLGDGTEESHYKINAALNELWKYKDEMFEPSDYEIACAQINIGTDLTILRNEWIKTTIDILEEATLSWPDHENETSDWNGKKGNHTKYLQDILEEMQYLQRTYPGCEW